MISISVVLPCKGNVCYNLGKTRDREQSELRHHQQKQKRWQEQNSISVAKRQEWTCFFSFFPFFFLLNVETAECTEAATQTINSHPIFSVQSNPVSWALCHVWTDPVTAPTQAQLWQQKGCCYSRTTLALAESELICSAVEDGSGSELNTREKDWHKALGKEPNMWRETYPLCLYSKSLNFVVDCSRHFLKLI